MNNLIKDVNVSEAILKEYFKRYPFVSIDRIFGIISYMDPLDRELVLSALEDGIKNMRLK